MQRLHTQYGILHRNTKMLLSKFVLNFCCKGFDATFYFEVVLWLIENNAFKKPGKFFRGWVSVTKGVCYQYACMHTQGDMFL